VFETLLKRIAVVLNEAGLPYMVFGGQAVLLYGEPRMTRDIDITLGVAPDEAAVVIRAVNSLELQILAKNAEEFIRETLVLPVVDPQSGIRVDFVFSLSQFEQAAIARANVVDLGGIAVRFASLEDLIVMKIIAGRPRDLEDVASVLRKNPQADRDFIVNWLHQFEAELETNYSDVFQGIASKIRKQ
jgi:predicted nucleotidyltransferase